MGWCLGCVGGGRMRGGVCDEVWWTVEWGALWAEDGKERGVIVV